MCRFLRLAGGAGARAHLEKTAFRVEGVAFFACRPFPRARQKIRNFEEISVKETGTVIETKSGSFTDENSLTHNFTLWQNQFKGLFDGTKIKISNGYLSFNNDGDETINIISKNDIEVISG